MLPNPQVKLINEIVSSQYFYFILLMIPTAIVAGFFAGFFGIGGGLITIPVLLYIFKNFGINETYIMHLAVGTSFSIIIPTAIASVLTHFKNKAVDVNIVKSYGGFVILGVIIGSYVAAILQTKILVLFFVIVLYILSLNFFFQKDQTKIKIKLNFFNKTVFGISVGFVSSLTGIGGAIMNVPIMKLCGYNINRAIGSSAAIGFFIALFGAAGFLISGSYLQSNLPLSIGFINIPAFLIFVPITTFMARIGASLLHKVDKKLISKLFGVFLIIVASKLLFDYLNL